MTDIDTLRRAAEALDRDTSITLLTSHDRAPDGVSRVGGPGFDLGERQPRGGEDEQQAMTHIWTIATADVPALASAYPGAAAVALYMQDPQENEAWEAFNGLTALVLLTAEDRSEVLAEVRNSASTATAFSSRPRRSSAAPISCATACCEPNSITSRATSSPSGIRASRRRCSETGSSAIRWQNDWSWDIRR